MRSLRRDRQGVRPSPGCHPAAPLQRTVGKRAPRERVTERFLGDDVPRGAYRAVRAVIRLR